MYHAGSVGIGTTNPQTALDVRGAITVGVGTVGINSISSTTDIQSWYYTNKSKSVTVDEGTPNAVYVGASGTAMFMLGGTGNDVNQYTLSTPYDVSTAGASVAVFSVETQDTNPQGIDFHPNGTKMFVLGQTGVAPLVGSGDYVHEYSLSTAWTVSSAVYTTSFRVTQDVLPTGVTFGNSGSKMYVVGSSGDNVYQYSLSTPYSLASGVTYDNISLSFGALETAPTDISFNSTGTALWVIGGINDRIYEFRLGTAWNISTAVFYDDVYVGFNEITVTGLHVISEQNVAYIVGTNSDTVFQYSTNTPAIEIASSGISSVSSIILNNETRVKDNLYVKGNTHIDGNTLAQGTLTVDSTTTLNAATIGSATVTGTLTGNTAVTFDTTTNNINLGTNQTSGNLIVGSTSPTTSTITLGRATTSQTTNIQAGASGVGTTKTINFGTGGASGSFTQINIGPTAGVGTVAINSGTNLGIGSATPTSKLDVVGDAKFTGVVTATSFSGTLSGYATSAGIATYATSAGIATYATSSGIATYATNAGIATYATSSGIATYATNAGIATYATNAGIATALQNSRTFEITGDIVASAISFDGTGNVSLAATIQPNSVGLGTDTTGDYVQSITGTSNQISVSVTSGESTTPVISIPDQFTIPQDATVIRDLQVNRNLNVTGNITIGGTSAAIFAQELKISDPDIVLGFRTDAFGNDISNDSIANHGGVALASTEGTPLVNLFIAGIEINPSTYKKIMWFKEGTFAGLGTDAWLFNYAVGIGSTQFPNGTRLAAGNVQFTQNDLAVVRNINASGVITATTFSGTLSGYATSAGVSTSVIGGIASVTQLSVSGVSTLGITSATNLTARQLNVSGLSTFAGITTHTAALFGTTGSFAGIVTASSFRGDGSQLTGLVPNTVSASTTTTPQFIGFLTTNSGITTSILASSTLVFIPSSGNLGIGTTNPTSKLFVVGDGRFTGVVTATSFSGTLSGYASSAGISTYATTAGIATYATTAGIATYATTAGIATYATSSGVSTSVIGGIASVTQLHVNTGISTLGTVQISSGIITATSGVVTYYGDGSKLTGIQTSGDAGAAGGTSGQIQYNNAGILTGANFFNYDNTTARVGIGTALPTARLSVASTTTGNSLMVVNDNLSDGSVFRVNDNSANVLIDIDANGTILFPTTGNVGIGTTLTSPSSKLQVIGTVSATTFSGNLTGVAATISTVQISSGIITATSGVVTYYGFGGNLTGILTSGSAGGSTGQLQYNLGGIPSGANFFNYDNTTARVGIGTSLPTARLSVASTSTGNSLLIVNDNLNDGTLFRVNDNSANVLMDIDANGTILFPTTGNVGIGTTLVTPTSKLQVAGDVLVSGVVTATTFSGNLTGTAITAITGIITNIVGVAATISTVKISSGIVTASAGVVTYYGDGSKLSGVIALTNVGAGSPGQMQFNDSGPLGGASFFNYDKTTARVGIGTALPTARLSVASTTTGASLMVVNDNLSDGSVFRVNDNSANVLMDIDANGTILFPTTGNVGIGTTLVTPTSKLQVAGDVLVSGVVTATTYNGQVNAGIGTITTIIGAGASIGIITARTELDVGVGGTFATINSTGLGIGTAPASRFNVSSPSTGNSLMVVNDNLSDGSLFRVNDNSANVLFDIDANGTILFPTSGNIGIGTTVFTPTSKLQVVGNVLISGIVTAGTLQISSGIVTATTGVVTYYGDGSKLSNIISGVSISTNTTNQAQYLTYVTGTGSTTGFGVTIRGLVFNPSSNTLGIGTTNPTSTLTVTGNALVSGASTFGTVRISSGIITATTGVVTYFGDGSRLTGITSTSSGINIVGVALSVSGISTFGTVRISSGIITATTGVVTYFGDGSRLTGVSLSYAASSGVSTYATSAGIATYADNAGIATYATSSGTATTATNLADAANITTGTINKDRISTTNALTVLGDLYVSNNISFGGTTTQLNLQQLKISDPDIVLGFRTDAFGNDISNDTTANHGGIAVASTEGNPLVNLNIAGIETNPSTYKKIMWFKSGAFAGLGTDAWLFNYAVGIGSTQFPNGTRLAAGGMQVTDTTISTPNLNVTGITTTNNLYVSGISTLGTVQISTGIIAATTGVVTYYGSGINLTGIVTSIVAGTNITVSDSTGKVTINAAGGVDLLEVMLFT
jgi:hypothetical protein